MSSASTEGSRDSTRLNLLRALNPQDAYPNFRLPISVEGARYDLVLSSALTDKLSGRCTGDEREELDDPVLSTPEKLRAALLKRTSTGPDRDRLLYGKLELETVTHVGADRLCEIAEYRYLFVSQGIARQLCRDAEADRLPPKLSEYVLLHRSVFTKCGGFELLAACFEALDDDMFVKVSTPVDLSTSGRTIVDERRAFLRGLL